MNEQNALMRKIRTADFAMWELHIFLDSHPDDADALALMNKYSMKKDALVAEYEKLYGPMDMRNVTTGNRWLWVNNPWPWEVTEGDE